MENRDLYNENRQKTGEKILKSDPIPENKYIMMVVIFIENDKNEFLIQKRCAEKGGKWATTGGHPKSGENSLEGILTEVKEELGINISKPLLFKQAGGKNTYCDLYYIKENIDIKSIKIQKEEVDEVKWASIDEINTLMENDKFNKGHYMMFKDCLAYLSR